MKIRKFVKDVELAEDEAVYKAAVSVGIYDDDGNLQKIKKDVQYIVSGDCGEYFIKPEKKKKTEVKEDDSSVSA